MEKKTKVIKHKFQSLIMLGKYFKPHYNKHMICPQCQSSVSDYGINELAYTNDVCTCREKIEYDHVVDQAWHKKCLVLYLTEHPEQMKEYIYS